MKIIGLVEGIAHVCCRYRLRSYADGFADQGISLELRPIGSGISRWRNLADVTDADVVILQRKLLASWEIDRLRRHSRRLIFDFDDAVFSRDSYHPRGQDSSKHRRRFEATVRVCDAVVAGNAWLADQALQAGADRPMTIPTCVDPDLYHPSLHNHDRPGLTMVWVGSSSTLQGLELERVLLETLGLRVPGLKLRVVCDQSIEFRHLPVEYCPWSEADEASAIGGADVGLSLLPDDEWSRGKCGLKVLQYMAAGLPVVGNPVGVTAELIGKPEDPFRAGVLASNSDDFVAALESMRSPAVRRQLGSVARRRVIERFSIKAGLQRWLRLLGDLASARRAG